MITIGNVVISAVKIIDNEKFKKYIKMLKDEFPHYLLSNESLHQLEQEQEEIRRYIFNNEQDLDFTIENFKITPVNKPELFLIMLSINTALDLCNSFTDILNQNIQEDVGDELNTGGHNDGETFCACGKGVAILHAPIINNKITNKFLLIGCCCAKKAEILTQKQVSAIYKKRRSIISLKKKEINKSIKTIQDTKNLKLKQSIFNVFKNNWIIKKQKEIRRLNTLVYLSIPAYDKHIASFYGCNWNSHIKKWCTTMAVYELNKSLHKYKSFTPYV